ncbi:L-sorbose 1-dehydrogenase [Botrytis cinerea]
MAELARHTSVIQRLQKELLPVNLVKTPSEEIDSLPLLDAILMETLRLYPAVLGPFTHKVLEKGAMIGKYLIPGGVTISASAYTLHRNPDVFPDPLKWNPDRWLDASPEANKQMMRWHCAFGSGRSMCSGNYFAVRRPWITQTFNYFSWLFQAYRAFTDCAKAMDFIAVPDFNAPDAPPEGVTTLSLTLSRQRERVSSFEAFLPKKIALERRNLTICTNALVSRIVFTEEKGLPHTEKILFKSSDQKSDNIYSVKINKEVIVCSGAVGSPQVLMLSGIGPRECLEEHGIKVVHDLPGVGSTLTDHHSIPVAWEVPAAESLTSMATSPLKIALELFKYIFFQVGLFSIPVQTLALYVRSRMTKEDSTGLVEEVSPKSFDPQTGWITLTIRNSKNIFSKTPIFCVLATILQPKSHGTVRLASSNPHDKPKVDFGILSDDSDYTIARSAVRLTLFIADKIKASGFPLLRNLTFPAEKQELDAQNNTTEEMDKFIRKRIRTTFHYASTCRMAPEYDSKAPGVVDDELKVHGVKGLRVCDTSIFPKIVSGHLQAPAVMVAEKCADLIKNGP